ncbi:hypothetical protein [Staphylococcus phage vB_SepM_ phiIPLA-C1C]|jgi:hypothetical protein|uniref:Uncharacterized protein n=2 Tax=Sepunavirus TaxID=1980928 RepID=A0A0D3MVC4_9CAUD|nr:hypothetical protein AVU40_gp106 [Staphylococcus phage phiIPLA-C1C]AXF38408.1 hypothetical protein Quidividi_178 [Staphylococcus phage Quidividi]AXF38613.1 hypothetical protein Twillingate_180 [Staphylococcus phage Twillingate]MDU0946485.1 hypothetical protein [Anaerococcus vaginalis]MDU7109196.1 hypothetical protein [Clostridium perfringens]QLF86909.1 hypothetical protein BESEP4_00175 [Staphylococcus phage vB_SepM_BE04]QLF87300.1 hypothetical protein BESEP6_00146 [Staphylococcus phage vB_
MESEEQLKEYVNSLERIITDVEYLKLDTNGLINTVCLNKALEELNKVKRSYKYHLENL